MKTTRLALIVMVLLLANCSRRMSELFDAGSLTDTNSYTESGADESNVGSVNSEDDSSDDDNQSQNNSQTSNSTSSNTSNNTSSNNSTTTTSQTTSTESNTQTTTQSAAPAKPAVVKRPVYRSSHYLYGNLYWTAAWSNVVSASANYGFAYQGVAFELATYPTNDCGVPIYACLQPQIGMYFLYHAESCGGSPNVRSEFLGYSCNPNSATSTYPVYGMRADNGYLVYTSSIEEVTFFQRYGYYVYGAYHAPR